MFFHIQATAAQRKLKNVSFHCQFVDDNSLCSKTSPLSLAGVLYCW